MNLSHHFMPQDLFDRLAAGGGGVTAVRQLTAAQYSKRVIMLLAVLAAAADSGPEQYLPARRGYDLLAAVQRHDPAAADKVIGYPSVGAWALRTVKASQGGPAWPGAEPAVLSAVAAAAAVRARLPAEIEVAAPGGVVVLPSLGTARVDGLTAVVHSGDRDAVISSAGRSVTVPADPQQSAPGWRGLRRINAGPLEVVIDDSDPFRMPALTNLAGRLSDQEMSRWRALVRDAWLLLEPQCHVLAAEVSVAITVIVPLDTSAYGQLSSSSAETYGAIAMSQPPDPDMCAVTLAHEVQHQKLAALLDMVGLTMLDDGRRYYAPWRDDPRPVGGLLHGAYAYLGVGEFWRQQRRAADGARRLRADREFARWRAGAAQVVETLQSSGRLTPAGVTFVAGMKETLSEWLAEPVPADARRLAEDAAGLHLARWQSAHGPLPT